MADTTIPRWIGDLVERARRERGCGSARAVDTDLHSQVLNRERREEETREFALDRAQTLLAAIDIERGKHETQRLGWQNSSAIYRNQIDQLEHALVQLDDARTALGIEANRLSREGIARGSALGRANSEIARLAKKAKVKATAIEVAESDFPSDDEAVEVPF